MHLPTLHTERLRLEPLTFAHSDGMFRLWREPEVCRFSGPAVDANGTPVMLPARTPADSDGIIAFFLARQRAGLGFRWAVLRLEDDEFLGALGFNALALCAELAFHLHPHHWGGGYMREASTAALAWLHTLHGVDEVEAWADAANTASHGLLARLGFVSSNALRDGAQRFVLPPEGG